MIRIDDAKIGLSVFYQKPHMRHPQYGVISGMNYKVVHVLFMFDTTAKACLPGDLFWPPNFCAQDGGKPGQLYQSPQEYDTHNRTLHVNTDG